MPSGVPRIPRPEEWILKKICTRCGEEKPWAKFSPGSYWDDGSVRCVQSYCQDCHAEINRNRPKKPIAPERLAYLVDYKRRQRAALRAERTSDGKRLPSAPIRELLNRAVKDTEDWVLLGEQCRMSERIFRRVMVQENVTLRLADAICTRLGVRVYDLYPELEEAA